MKKWHRWTLATLFSVAPPLTVAQALLQTDRSWDGNPFSYPGGTPRVTSLILSLDEGEVTPWHCHPVPTMGYVLEGSLAVETVDGKTTEVEQGQSVMEVMRTMHRGKGLRGGARIVVFYAGAEGTPNTVLHEADESSRYCGDPEN